MHMSKQPQKQHNTKKLC